MPRRAFPIPRTTSCEIDWADDETNDLLNKHMDVYEGWGSDFNDINELFLNKYKWLILIYFHVLFYIYII